MFLWCRDIDLGVNRDVGADAAAGGLVRLDDWVL